MAAMTALLLMDFIHAWAGENNEFKVKIYFAVQQKKEKAPKTTTPRILRVVSKFYILQDNSTAEAYQFILFNFNSHPYYTDIPVNGHQSFLDAHKRFKNHISGISNCAAVAITIWRKRVSSSCSLI
jgi:hypothetical protein